VKVTTPWHPDGTEESRTEKRRPRTSVRISEARRTGAIVRAMTGTLAEELDSLPEEEVRRLAAHRFDRAQFLALAGRLGDARAMDNRVSGEVGPPDARDVVDLPDAESADGKRLRGLGLTLLKEGSAALVVLAGGMATRMGSVVKALVPALPGRTFLELRLAEQRALERLTGKKVPLWLMTSAATDGPIREALGSRIDGESIAVFQQRLSLRLTPEGKLFRDEHGLPSEYAPGHGDLPDALRDSGLLDRFVQRGGKVVSMANLDNLGATLDPVILGLHVERGRPVSCEVVDKVAADRGGIPVRHGGRTVVLEEFRLPASFDASTVRVFNTNTFHFDAAALARMKHEWTYFVVTKKVDGAPVIQFERLVNELTSWLDTTYVRVPRTGAASRFLPVKDKEELAARQAELEIIARARGMLD
jgi:UTP--glucose-1-phosphate uridylyltransferase